MPGSYGNMNLNFVDASAFIDYDGAENVTLPVGTTAVTLRASTRCWITISDPGKTAVAAAPSAEKVWVRRTFSVDIAEVIDVAVPMSEQDSLVTVSVIKATVAGVLDVMARKED